MKYIFILYKSFTILQYQFIEFSHSLEIICVYIIKSIISPLFPISICNLEVSFIVIESDDTTTMSSYSILELSDIWRLCGYFPVHSFYPCYKWYISIQEGFYFESWHFPIVFYISSCFEEFSCRSIRKHTSWILIDCFDYFICIYTRIQDSYSSQKRILLTLWSISLVVYFNSCVFHL